MDWMCQTKARYIPNTSARSASSSDITVAVLTNMAIYQSTICCWIQEVLYAMTAYLQSIIHCASEMMSELHIVNMPFMLGSNTSPILCVFNL